MWFIFKIPCFSLNHSGIFSLLKGSLALLIRSSYSPLGIFAGARIKITSAGIFESFLSPLGELRESLLSLSIF